MVKLFISLSKRQISLTRRPCFLHNHLSYTTHQQNVSYKHRHDDQDMVSNSSLTILALCRNIVSLKVIHGLLIVHGLTGEILCDTKLVSLYGSFGQVRYARKVFDKIQNPDFYSCKVMIRWYFLNDLYVEIVRFYKSMKLYVRECDSVVLSIVLKACSELKDLNEGSKLHCHIVKAGNADSFVLTGLVDMYSKCGKIKCSGKAFDEITNQNVVSWTSMIVGYVQNDRPRDGLVYFNRMRESSVEANEFTYGSLVTACTKLGLLHQGKWLHGFAIKQGIELNTYLVSAILDMYVKCGNIEDARFVFNQLPTADLVSWTAMIVGYNQKGYPTEALCLFTDKKWIEIVPNSITVAAVLSSCGQSSNIKTGKCVHGLTIKRRLEDTTVLNALLDMYAKCGFIDDAWYIFETISKKDLIAWNSMISGFSQNELAYKSITLFNQLRLSYIKPDAVSAVSVLSACASLGNLAIGSSVHAYSIKEGLLSSNVYVGTSLLNFYAKCGDINSARIIFDAMRDKNTITWSAMIGGYGLQGESNESLELFDHMLKEELKPNEVIFTTILSACSHTGIVKEGWKYFDSMCRDYKFTPSVKHYSIMVDLLARDGRLEEALEFIENMPIQPDVSCFGAFLHGCGLYSRFDLGEMVIKKMIDLIPDKACYYVLIANLYASDGRWSRVNQVREMMRQRGLSKSPGHSSMERDFENDSRMANFA